MKLRPALFCVCVCVSVQFRISHPLHFVFTSLMLCAFEMCALTSFYCPFALYITILSRSLFEKRQQKSLAATFHMHVCVRHKKWTYKTIPTYNLQIGNSEIQREKEEDKTRQEKACITKRKTVCRLYHPLFSNGTKTNDFH